MVYFPPITLLSLHTGAIYGETFDVNIKINCNYYHGIPEPFMSKRSFLKEAKTSFYRVLCHHKFVMIGENFKHK